MSNTVQTSMLHESRRFMMKMQLGVQITRPTFSMIYDAPPEVSEVTVPKYTGVRLDFFHRRLQRCGIDKLIFSKYKYVGILSEIKKWIRRWIQAN